MKEKNVIWRKYLLSYLNMIINIKEVFTKWIIYSVSIFYKKTLNNFSNMASLLCHPTKFS